MTKPRDWPDNAKDARDGAAENVSSALRLIRQIIEHNGKLNDSDKMRALSLAAMNLQDALRWLESAGAQTRPPDL